jgi:hypothetical protein
VGRRTSSCSWSALSPRESVPHAIGRRWRELATRHAIGASVARVGRQVLTETTLLAVCGGAIGVAGGWWMLRVIASLDLELLPRRHEIGLDWQAAGAMLALARPSAYHRCDPAGAASRANLNDVMRDAGRSGTAGTGAGRLRRLLATAQVALAFVLLIGAGLLWRASAPYSPRSRIRAGRRVDRVDHSAGVAYRDGAALTQVAGRLLERTLHFRASAPPG